MTNEPKYLFFSYGIFMDGMVSTRHETEYATVKGYKTVGDRIVQAVPDETATLSGMVMLVTRSEVAYLDGVERHPTWYKRTNIELTDGREAFMYVKA